MTKRQKILLIGLTGSIGMGKSTTARFFAKCGAKVFCADQAVHALLKPQGLAFARVKKAFPEALCGKRLSRKKLGALVFQNPEKRSQLEKIVHPLVRKEQKNFLTKAKEKGARAVLFDIPLLFETGGEKNMDLTVCVTASKKVQRQRVLEREHMTPQKFKAILARQFPDCEKRRRADFVIRTDRGFEAAQAAVEKIWKEITMGFENA